MRSSVALAYRRTDQPKYLTLAKTLERQMRSGALRVGDRLPSIRQLRDAHQISVATAIGCYSWLERHGYVRARPKSGYYVSSLPQRESLPPTFLARPAGPVPVRLAGPSPASSVDAALDLGPAVMSPALLPRKRLNQSIRMALSAFDDCAVRYEDPRGNPRLRRQLARLMARQGTATAPDQIVVTAGQTEALNLTIRTLTSPGDVVAIESPGCYEFLQALESLQLRAVEIPHVSGKGIEIGRLGELVERHKVKALLVEATCHNALGDCASDQSKAALVEFASLRHLPIVEGDPFGDLIFTGERPRPLKSFDTSGVVIQCSSLAHFVAPGFNIGWVSAGRWQPEIEKLKASSSIAGSGLPQLALAEFLESGAYDRHTKHLRYVLWQNIEATRQEILNRFPLGTRVARPDGGFVLWVQLPEGWDAERIQERAATAGIRVLSGPQFSATGQYRNCLRIACGHPLDVLKSAVRRLSLLCKSSTHGAA